MKKLMILLCALVMLFALAACGSSGSEEVNADDQVITRSDTDTAEAEEPQETEEAEPEEAQAEEAAEAEDTEETESAPVELGDTFAYDADGVLLEPGTPFDASLLPDANSVYTVPSCAIDGTDNVYSYDAFEVTAYDEGNGEVIYSVYLTDANATTNEGVGFGDSLDTILGTYGDGYEESGTSVVYTLGDTQLIFILQDESIISIEYVVIL